MARRNSLGRISVDFVAGTSQFRTDVQKAGRAVNEFRRPVRQTSRAMGRTRRGFKSSSQAMLQLSTAVEDGAAVWGSTGFSGAVRAASNNLSQAASLLNPMAGVVVGLGAALASQLIPKLFDTGKAAKESEKQVQRLTETMERFNKAADRARAFKKFQLSLPDLSTAEQVKSRLKELKREEAVLRNQESIRKRQLKTAKETMAQVRRRERQRAQDESFFRLTPEEEIRAAEKTEAFKAARSNVRKLQDRLGEVQIKLLTNAFKKGRLKVRLKEVRLTPREQAARRGKEFVDKMGPTPREQFGRVQQDLKAALKQRVITEKQYNRALAKARKDFEKSRPKATSGERPGERSPKREIQRLGEGIRQLSLKRRLLKLRGAEVPPVAPPNRALEAGTSQGVSAIFRAARQGAQREKRRKDPQMQELIKVQNQMRYLQQQQLELMLDSDVVISGADQTP